MSKYYKKLNRGSKKKLSGASMSAGFTLVETLVAISIFTMSILGLMIVLSQGVSDTSYAKMKITASYLGQEGIEYVRNIRDTFVLYDEASSQNGWEKFNEKLINESCGSSNGCYFDDQNLNYANPLQPMADINVIACDSLCPYLLYDAISGKYGYVSGENSGFIRTIKIIVVSPNETKIFSTVSWEQGSGNYNITFTESLFNWME